MGHQTMSTVTEKVFDMTRAVAVSRRTQNGLVPLVGASGLFTARKQMHFFSWHFLFNSGRAVGVKIFILFYYKNNLILNTEDECVEERVLTVKTARWAALGPSFNHPRRHSQLYRLIL